jgi:hypothetical protein
LASGDTSSEQKKEAEKKRARTISNDVSAHASESWHFTDLQMIGDLPV